MVAALCPAMIEIKRLHPQVTQRNFVDGDPGLHLLSRKLQLLERSGIGGRTYLDLSIMKLKLNTTMPPQLDVETFLVPASRLPMRLIRFVFGDLYF